MTDSLLVIYTKILVLSLHFDHKFHLQEINRAIEMGKTVAEIDFTAALNHQIQEFFFQQVLL